MSSILKALKKVEDDKATRSPDDLKINSEILRIDNAPRASSTGVLLTSMFLLAIGSGGTYMYMKHDKPAGGTSASMTSQSSPLQSSFPAIKSEQLPEAIIVVPAQKQINKNAAPIKTIKPVLSVRTEPSAFIAKPARRAETTKPVDKETTPQSPQPQLSPAAFGNIPALRVNGIALSDGNSGSVAMINGVPVSNGSLIDGVRVEEIFNNKVRFSYNKEIFEINLGQSNR